MKLRTLHQKNGAGAPHPDYAVTALALQGGGALGSYQAGVYQGLAEGGIHPNWVAGISIGALNAAVIAGNPPERRVEQLRAFWEFICRQAWWPLESACRYLAYELGPKGIRVHAISPGPGGVRSFPVQ